ncbi:hypothetical protein [Actinoplanes sp. NBRC 103695]|uniref:hypothetical protein n=1 Tax=Actinoplanes sp. NBRC 103695 TaxID=3032202 RepID=UPI0024A5A273|nr:hypothetical protein [Actinoplanes sp. NBRC 103695]GLY97649.1 hypothetical protein Acsp02_49030 [Actinoplanes sp. NBRC 103695]
MPQNQPRISTQPRLMLDTSSVIFEMADEIMPKIDEKTGTQKLDSRDTGLPMWVAPMFGRGRAAGRKWSGQLNVTVVSAEKPAAEDGDRVVPLDLEALPWVSEQNGKTRNGVAFKASGLEVVSTATVKAA